MSRSQSGQSWLRRRLSSGSRDRLVTIQQLSESAGSSHFPVETWTDLVTVSMSRLDIRGIERLQAMQVRAKVDAAWEMNYRADMDPDLVDVQKKRRLSFNGRLHDITYANQIGRREGIELTTIASSEVPA